MKKALILMLAVLLFLSSCQKSTYPCEVLEALDSQEYYVVMDLGENRIYEIAQKGDCYMIRDREWKNSVFCKGDTVVSLDPEEKQYTTGVEEESLDVRKLRLEQGDFSFVKAEQTEDTTVYHCLRKSGGPMGFGEENPYRFVYQNGKLIRIETDVMANGAVAYTTRFPVLEFQSELPDHVSFAIPEDYSCVPAGAMNGMLAGT